MWEHLVDNFNFFPIEEQISTTPERLDKLRKLQGLKASKSTNVSVQSLPKIVRNLTIQKMSYFVESTI